MPKHYSLLLFAAIIYTAATAQTFQVSYPAATFSGPFTGKVILYLNKENRNPKDAMADLESFPCFSLDVHDVRPGTSILFDDRAAAYPVKLSDIERGEYYVQAVWDRNLGGRAIAESPGNLYSLPLKAKLTKDVKASFTLTCDQVVAQPKFTETTRLVLSTGSPMISVLICATTGRHWRRGCKARSGYRLATRTIFC